MRTRLAAAVCLALTARLAIAGAAEPPDSSKQSVLVAVRGSEQDLTAFRLVLDELLARIDLSPDFSLGAPQADDASDGAFATVLVDVTGRNSASVAVQEGRSGRVRLLRQVEHAGSRALLIDTAAHVIYAMLDTMVREKVALRQAASQPSADDATPERPAPIPLLARTREPVPSALRAAPWGLELSPFYGVRSFALPEQRPMMNAGLAVSAGARAGRWQPSLSLSASYGLDVELGSAAGLPGQGFGRLQVTSLHATPIVNLIGSGRLLLQLGLSGGLDIVRVATSPPPMMMGPPGPMGPGNFGPTPPVQSRHLDPLMGGLLVGRVRIVAGTQLFLSAAADYGPTYSIQTGFGSTGALQMPHWRFGGSLGLSVTLGGRAPGWPPRAGPSAGGG